MEIITSSGVKLITNKNTERLESWAVEHWGIRDAQFFQTETGSYLFVRGETPVEEKAATFEQVCYWIDVWALANGFEQLSGWATFRQ